MQPHTRTCRAYVQVLWAVVRLVGLSIEKGAVVHSPQILQTAELSASVAYQLEKWSIAIRMRQVFKSLGLLLLLMVAQQGAVVHELSHVVDADHVGLRAQTDAGVDKSCALCPAFAQVVTPAFSHSFHIPFLVRLVLDPVSEPQYAAIDAAVPRPRSRGPPSLS